MKQFWKLGGFGAIALMALSLGLLSSGCQTNQPVFEEIPGVATSTNSAGTNRLSARRHTTDVFQIGDQVIITYSGTSATNPLLQSHQEAIKDDGTITPPYVGPVVAAGKTPGRLQKELQEKYDYYFKNLTVTVVPRDRFYYVSGEVRKPGPEPWLGETDIIQAIAAAGDFTDFANKKRVRLTRANGRTQIINVQRAITEPHYEVPVYPGDKIYVPRRLF